MPKTLQQNIATPLTLFCATLWIAGFLLAAPLTAQDGNQEKVAPSSTDEPSVRHFNFTYAGSIDNLPVGKKARVWLPVANGMNQRIVNIEIALPAPHETNKDEAYGNNMLYFEATGTGKSIPFSVTYEVERDEVNGLLQGDSASLGDNDKKLFLNANKKVPIDGKPLTLIKNIRLGGDRVSKAQSLYDCVEDYMTYDKSKPGYGNGDVLWACDSKTGNCTDFHSVFISLARSQNIPAHFEIGFPIPTERGEGKVGGYHCWARFYIEQKGWVPVDISEADKHPEMKEYYFGNLTENRIGFSKGRDINLVPKQDAEALNFFVYPHVEVDGEMWDRENITLNFQYKDIGVVTGQANN